ncbi:hypothetical protein [Alkalimarinus sediminis]|uniref:Uncharacterized protein n=1 Tax=Alkalimarinus sediminis TaxID=1632866 RepID=A0A9E8HHZ6_9ALTE|nr:hypothetical protein [Alkalimarinus sediminis]UZW74537.1 hypothetical protein NNL22_16160 [Alkalimarinus sediminis]
MERITYNIVVTWREGEASFQSLDQNDFEIMRCNMIDSGFENLHVEWYALGDLPLPDKIMVFVYWEKPDVAPEYEQVRKWGKEVIESQRT